MPSPVTSFAAVADDAECELALNYAPGSGTVALSNYGATLAAKVASLGQGKISSGLPLRFTMFDDTYQGNFLATSLSGETLGGVTPDVGTSDIHIYKAGSGFAVLFVGRQLIDLQGALNNVESGQPYNVIKYGARGDQQTVTATGIVAGSHTLSVAGYAKNAADVGKAITVDKAGASGGTLGSTIASVADGLITMADPAVANVASSLASFGSDDTATIQAAIDAAEVTGGEVLFPIGNYLTTAPLLLPSNVTLRGHGPTSVIAPSLVFSNAAPGGHAIIEAIGTTERLTNNGIKDLVLDTRGSRRAASHRIPYQLILNNAEHCTVERVIFRDHGYGI